MADKKGVKKYIITAAQSCYYRNKDGDLVPWGGGKEKAIPHKKFLSGLEVLAQETGAELIITPMQGRNTRENILHPELESKNIFYGSLLWLNQNVQLRDIIVPPQNVDPATGKATLVSKYNSSLIFGHSKQRYLPVPVFNADLPRYIFTTGAVTLPNYNTGNHKGDTAERNHVFGALLVEIIDNVHYNIRNIRALKNGKFADLGRLYDGDKSPKPISIDALVLGDIHWGDHDPKTIEANYEMIDYFKPKRIFLHDFFNGHSVNPHEIENPLIRAREFERGRLSLEEELMDAFKELNRLANYVGKKTEIYLVSSNHHSFLPRYINSQIWLTRDIWNAKICAELFSRGVSLDQIDESQIDDASYLIEEGLKRFGKLPSNVHFLRVNDNYRRYGYQLASHGDKGKSGARGGSAKARYITGGGKSITGHSHQMEIYGDTYIVGTSSRLDLPYTAGYGSASIAANATLSKIGTVQILPIIKGKWKARD